MLDNISSRIEGMSYIQNGISNRTDDANYADPR